MESLARPLHAEPIEIDDRRTNSDRRAASRRKILRGGRTFGRTGTPPTASFTICRTLAPNCRYAGRSPKTFDLVIDGDELASLVLRGLASSRSYWGEVSSQVSRNSLSSASSEGHPHSDNAPTNVACWPRGRAAGPRYPSQDGRVMGSNYSTTPKSTRLVKRVSC